MRAHGSLGVERKILWSITESVISSSYCHHVIADFESHYVCYGAVRLTFVDNLICPVNKPPRLVCYNLQVIGDLFCECVRMRHRSETDFSIYSPKFSMLYDT